MHQTADSFSCSRPENHRGDHPCNGAFFSICCFISDSIYSWQKVQEVGSLKTASCLRGCLAWFMCMKTDSHRCVGSCYLSWLKPSSVYYMRSLKKNMSRHFFKTSQYSINFPSCCIRWNLPNFKHKGLSFLHIRIFNILHRWISAQLPTVAALTY